MSTEIDCKLQPVIADSREAFGEIVRRYQNMVSAVTFSMTGNLQQSEDLAQETFVAAWQNQRELHDPEKLPAWLCGIARNLSRNWLRRTETERLARIAASMDDMPENGTHPNPAGKLEREEQAALLWATLEKIPEPYREPLVMFYRQNQAVSEIAAALETSEENVRQRLVRGRAYLKEEVEQLVESALETLRPGPGFAMAVLAAIPVLTTAPEVFAATTAATVAGAAAKSGGSASLPASVITYCLSLVYAAFFPIVTIFGSFSGAWSCVNSSPTLRSRRFMLKVVLFHTTVIAMSFFLLCSLGNAMALYTSLDGNNSFFPIYDTFLFLQPVYFLAAMVFVNRKWLRIVTEDFEGRTPDTARQSRQRFFLWCLGIPVLAQIPFVGFAFYHVPIMGWSIFGHMFSSFLIDMWLLSLVAMTGLYFLLSMQLKNEASMQKFPPRVPNILSVLAGREKPRTGYRFRSCFWGDTVMIGIGLCMFEGLVCADSLANVHGISTLHTPLGIWLLSVLSLSFLGHLAFAVFFAGIPRRRYWGFIFLAAWLSLVNLPYLFIIEPWLLQPPTYKMPFRENHSVLFFLVCEYLVCLAGIGMAGLYLFRTKVQSKPGTFQKDKT